MAKYLRADWDPATLLSSAYFQPIHEALKPLASRRQWPALADYQYYLESNAASPVTGGGRHLRVVTQDLKAESFQNHYAPRIYLSGEMQTRLENWHDFFQVVTWRVFPETKRIINSRHYHAAQSRFDTEGNNGRRSAVENLLSLFDECGAVVVSDDESLLTLIRQFDWKQLFFHQRDSLLKHTECILFGHALYEKSFRPYVGMTANAILVKVDSDYFKQNEVQRLSLLDGRLSECIGGDAVKSMLNGPQDLSPLPLLGFPGYWPDNHHAEFYDNTRYFRPGRGVIK